MTGTESRALMRPSLLAALLAFLLVTSVFGQTSNDVAPPDIDKGHDVNVQSSNWVQAAVARESARRTLTFSHRSHLFGPCNSHDQSQVGSVVTPCSLAL